jgi:hypothetical protein
VLWSFDPALDERFIDDHLGRHIRQVTLLPGFNLFSHRLKVPLHAINATEMHSISENDFECFASTGVNTPETMFPNRTRVNLDVPQADSSFLPPPRAGRLFAPWRDSHF